MGKLVVIFNVPGMTQPKYQEILSDLVASGAGHPPGRMSHLASTNNDGMIVVDTFDSQASFEAFGKTLMPILGKHGVKPPALQVLPVVNEIFPPGK